MPARAGPAMLPALRSAALRSAALLSAALVAATLAGCTEERAERSRVAGGDPQAGRRAIEAYGCGTCHAIPGVRGADGIVGPPLHTFARHVYLAGKFPNQPEWLVRWLQDPTALAPETAMPDLGIDEARARDIAAYLYELR